MEALNSGSLRAGGGVDFIAPAINCYSRPIDIFTTMAPIRNSAIIFKSKPLGPLVPGEHLVFQDDSMIDINAVPLNGGIITKTAYLGLDPWLRGRMMYEYALDKP